MANCGLNVQILPMLNIMIKNGVSRSMMISKFSLSSLHLSLSLSGNEE